MKKKILAGLTMIVLSGSALAANIGTTFNASATLNHSCTLGITDVDFGEYSPTATADTLANSTATIKCTKGSAWNFYTYAAYYVDHTATSETSGVSSRMAGPNSANFLRYQVKTATGLWDNDIDEPTQKDRGHFLGNGTGAEQILILEYRIFKNQYVSKGNYKDTATAYIDF